MRPTVVELPLLLDGATPIRLMTDAWPGGVGRTAYVALYAMADGGDPLHVVLGALVAADADGRLVLDVDPTAAQAILRPMVGERVWLRASLTAAERAAAGDHWLPVPYRITRPQ